MDDFKHIKVLNEKRNVISYIKPIYQLANFLALSPPYNFDYIEKKTKAGNYKYYPVIFVSFIISAYCYGMYGSVKKIYPYSQTTTVVIQILFYFLIVLSNVISMLGGGFYSWKSWNLMLDTFSKVDSQVNFYKSESTSNKTFYFQIFVGHVFLFIVFGFDIYVGVENYGMDIYQYYMCVRFQLYFILIEVILMCNFAISIKKRFKYFNDILRKISWNENKLFVIKSKQKSITSLSLNSFGKLTDLKSITRMFTVLSELVELYNKIFGWQILILMGIVLLSLLESFNFIMVYGISTKETFGRKSPIDMIALSLLTTAMLLVCYDILFNKEKKLIN